MEDTNKPARKGPPDGHPRYGGRRKGSLNRRTQFARDLAEKMRVDPVEFLLQIVATDAVQVPVTDSETGTPLLNEDGSPKRVWQVITLNQRIDAAKALLGYLYPKLQAVQITDKDLGPTEVTTLDVAEILADPELAKAAQTMALMLIEQRADRDGDLRTGEVLTRERGALLPGR